jgi:hypothetical protein
MMDSFVMVDGLIAEVNYDHLRAANAGQGHSFSLPSGKRSVAVSVGFLRRDMSLVQALGLAHEKGFRPALLPETIPVIHGGNHRHLEEIFRAMMIAAKARGKNWSTNCLAIGCAGKNGVTPVHNLVHENGSFHSRIDYRKINPSSPVCHFLGLTFVRAQ